MDDETLVSGLRSRDKAAIEAFWSKYYERVHAICSYILGNGPDSTDMTLDILVDFIDKYVDQLGNSKATFMFLRQMAIRRSMRLRDKINRNAPFTHNTHQSPDPSPEENVETNLLMPYLDHCLDRINPKARAALRLKYTRKISNEEIGHRIGGSKAYIGRLLKKARESLRKCIENQLWKKGAESSPSPRWRDPKPSNVSLDTVDRLLEAKKIHESEACEAFARMVNALSEFNNQEETKWAHDHLKTCSECREAALFLQHMDGEAAPPLEKGSTIGPRLEPWKAISVAAAAVVALVLSFVLINRRSTTAQPDTMTLAAKGEGDAFFVAAKRRGTAFTVRPLDNLEEGDELGLFYTAKTPGYLAIFSRDQEANVELLYPASGQASAAISEGVKKPLSDGAIVDHGEGCEWLVAVFSDTALDVDGVAEEIASADGLGPNQSCQLTPIVAGARRVIVLPVER